MPRKVKLRASEEFPSVPGAEVAAASTVAKAAVCQSEKRGGGGIINDAAQAWRRAAAAEMSSMDVGEEETTVLAASRAAAAMDDTAWDGWLGLICREAERFGVLVQDVPRRGDCTFLVMGIMAADLSEAPARWPVSEWPAPCSAEGMRLVVRSFMRTGEGRALWEEHHPSDGGDEAYIAYLARLDGEGEALELSAFAAILGANLVVLNTSSWEFIYLNTFDVNRWATWVLLYYWCNGCGHASVH